MIYMSYYIIINMVPSRTPGPGSQFSQLDNGLKGIVSGNAPLLLIGEQLKSR